MSSCFSRAIMYTERKNRKRKSERRESAAPPSSVTVKSIERLSLDSLSTIAHYLKWSKCPIARKSSTKSAVSTNTRTTRTGLINVVRAENIVFHSEFPVKADKQQSALVKTMLDMHVKWGNLSAPPKLQKSPYALEIDDSTVVYFTVITHPDVQCAVCGTWDKSDYCPACRGEIVKSDSVDADL